MNFVVGSTLGLVKGRLGAGLLVVGLGAADKAVSSVGDGLAGLLLGRLGGVRSELLLSLCGVVSNKPKGE